MPRHIYMAEIAEKYKGTARDVRVRVGRAVVTVEVESTVVQVLVIVTTNVQYNPSGIIVTIITPNKTPDIRHG